MDYYFLGNTGIKVSALCFGALPMGPLQAGLSTEEGGALLLAALEKGINFIDTAELYATYPQIKWALERYQGQVVLASKSTATSYRDMKNSIERSLNELGRDQIEIFHLHAARDSNPLDNRKEALEAILENKRKGYIKAAGLATHSVTGVQKGGTDPRIDVIFPLINRLGMGILDGGIPEMAAEIKSAMANGKGLYVMKALAGGHLIKEVENSIKFVRNEVGVPVIAVGMLRREELEMNLAIFEGRPVQIIPQTDNYRKRTKVTFLCKGCGRCLKVCHSEAISIVNGQALIDNDKCLLCGYCSSECPEFAIRVI